MDSQLDGDILSNGICPRMRSSDRTRPLHWRGRLSLSQRLRASGKYFLAYSAKKRGKNMKIITVQDKRDKGG